MIVVVFLVGLFPAIIMVLLNYAYLVRKYRPAEVPIDRKIENPVKEKNVLELVAENEKDKLVLLPDDLLFIEASDNYCTVFHLSQQKLIKTLLRSSLSRLENQISNLQIKRIHRSYIVNFNRIHHISGNAQGYKLHFEQVESPIPVARSYSSLLKESLLPG
jgi:DNA-binding LytR/AlgR family response regulator